MTTTTRAINPETALKHVLTNVLSSKEGSAYHFVLNECGVNDINSFMSVDRDDFETDYSFDEKVIKLNRVQLKRLLYLQEWYRCQSQQTVQTWFSLTEESFIAFVNKGSLSKGRASPTTVYTATVSSQPSLVSDFKKSIK